MVNKSINVIVVVNVEEGRMLRENIIWVVVFFVGSIIGISYYERNSIVIIEEKVGMFIFI